MNGAVGLVGSVIKCSAWLFVIPIYATDTIGWWASPSFDSWTAFCGCCLLSLDYGTKACNIVSPVLINTTTWSYLSSISHFVRLQWRENSLVKATAVLPGQLQSANHQSRRVYILLNIDFEYKRIWHSGGIFCWKQRLKIQYMST